MSAYQKRRQSPRSNQQERGDCRFFLMISDFSEKSEKDYGATGQLLGCNSFVESLPQVKLIRSKWE